MGWINPSRALRLGLLGSLGIEKSLRNWKKKASLVKKIMPYNLKNLKIFDKSLTKLNHIKSLSVKIVFL